MGLNAEFGTKSLRLRQEGDRRIDPDNLRTTLRQCERVPPLATTNVNDVRIRG